MRKLLVAVTAAVLTAGPAMSAHADPDPRATTGEFSGAFREDAFGADGRGFDPATGCRGEKPNIECLPTAATQNVLRDGRVLYWNAIENSENLQGPAAGYGGDTAGDDQSRVLTVNAASPGSSTWAVPANPTGYFAGSSTEPSIIPGGDNTNSSQSPANDGSLFCSDQKQLADGRILAAGGTNYYSEPRLNDQVGLLELEGIKNSRVFDPATNAWATGPSMKYGRWYPAMTTLADGKILVASGVTKLVKPVYGPDNTNGVEGSGTNVKQLEIYDPAANDGAGAWSEVNDPEALRQTSHRSLPLFPRLHMLPNGHVYYDAAGQAFNPFGQSYDEALWNIASAYDPASTKWRDLGIPQTTIVDTEVGQMTEPGFRGSTFSQMLPLVPDANGYYTSVKFLSAGGVLGTTPGSYRPTDTSRVNHVSLNLPTGIPNLRTKASGKLSAPRWYASGVTLPNGSVFVVSGADIDEVATPGWESAIRTAELWNPATGQFSVVGEQSHDRTYHNNAVLLHDGSVLIGGHSPIPANYGDGHADNPDVPGVRDNAPNHKDASFEIYRPPYLFRGDRPVIDGVIGTPTAGSTLEIATADAAALTHVTLVRNPSVTHLVDADQRIVDVPILSRSATSVTVSLPDTRVLPAGPYMLFVAKGEEAAGSYVPSVAAQVLVAGGGPLVGQVGRADMTPPVVAAPPAPASVIGGGDAVSGSDGSGPSKSSASAPSAGGSSLVADLVSSPVLADRLGDWARLPLALAAFGSLALAVAALRRRTRPSRY